MLYNNISISTVCKADELNPRHSEASIIKCKNGDILLAWQRFEKSDFGSGDEAPSTIAMIKSKDRGNTWQDERIIVPRTDDCVNVYSPNLLRLTDDSIALFYMKYNQLEYGKPQLASIFIMHSYDEGQTFSEPIAITKGQRITISNDCICRISSGRIVFPVSLNEGDLWSSSEHILVSTLYSDDDGQSWQLSPHRIDLPMRGVMEPFICEATDRSIVMVMRNQLGSVFRSESKDGGITWSKPQTTGLSAPESCPFIIKVPQSSAMLVVWNNSEYDMHFRSHYGKRTPFTIAVTYDNARTFKEIYNIETQPTYAFSNPGGTWVANDELFLTYWACPYDENWIMNGLIDLKLARIKINRDIMVNDK